jgi:hypothetical protein
LLLLLLLSLLSSSLLSLWQFVFLVVLVVVVINFVCCLISAWYWHGVGSCWEKKTVTQGANQRRTAFHVARDPVGFPFSGPELRNLSGLCVAIL